MRDVVTSRFGKSSAMQLIRFRSRKAVSVLQELGAHSELYCVEIHTAYLSKAIVKLILFHAQIYVKYM